MNGHYPLSMPVSRLPASKMQAAAAAIGFALGLKGTDDVRYRVAPLQ